MHFKINTSLLGKAQKRLSAHTKTCWIFGGSGSGKTTITKALAEKYSLPLYDMDAHIYGAYHERFDETRHPVNTAWHNAENGMAWLLDMDWEEFNNFHQAALPEYLDLLVEDIEKQDKDSALLIDGGIWHPALLAEAFPVEQIICLVTSENSQEIWEGNPERYAMREFFESFPNPEASWQKFLDFDHRITRTVAAEAQLAGITLLRRRKTDSVENLTTTVFKTLRPIES